MHVIRVRDKNRNRKQIKHFFTQASENTRTAENVIQGLLTFSEKLVKKLYGEVMVFWRAANLPDGYFILQCPTGQLALATEIGPKCWGRNYFIDLKLNQTISNLKTK